MISFQTLFLTHSLHLVDSCFCVLFRFKVQRRQVCMSLATFSAKMTKSFMVKHLCIDKTRDLEPKYLGLGFQKHYFLEKWASTSYLVRSYNKR